jgi:putative colanic acid biosynthesis acetyltransferase WcaF
MGKTALDKFDNSWYKPGSYLKRFTWYLTNLLLFKSRFFPLYGPKVWMLRSFGAKVGQGVVIKPSVNIKYPWKLTIGDHVWIGEDVWIDNLDEVKIGNHCCISQGALLLTGNHHYKKPSFDLIIKPITLEDGVWVGAKCVVTQGVICHSHSMLAVSSVASSNLKEYTIYRGNPALAIKERVIEG